jgi:hypothetical protein
MQFCRKWKSWRGDFTEKTIFTRFIPPARAEALGFENVLRSSAMSRSSSENQDCPRGLKHMSPRNSLP